ncbi:MerR family transcriptional regulator [Streptomyces johnsoniae]|uniref:MerR family transcriptional regulator n=1 Tax=Streptomyces johnsoniae TaxID=3075532 RepID=A0ABU2S5J1_9ACTN|nr:MerR family transcriptional regulator [Streptomyces sp. DSM 41886]MDT0444205.1 MerR family transcriptional regulator [Streptomyces sp. DSM 41886]
MRIGDLAQRIGASPRSLRYYEQQGLLSPSRDANGHREYDELALVRARNIKDLLDVGLTTQDVFHYMAEGCLERPLAESPPCTGELDTVRRRLAGLDERLAHLQKLRDRLAEHSATLEASIGVALDPARG